ncbi:MAG: DUF350 domain-containing protein [Pyrinomonadaceae bacterium]|nr:DUF350 domain-containing protein [Pyrinomonadaceae bacterium]
MINFALEKSVFALIVKFDQLAEVLLTMVILTVVGLAIFGIAYFVLHLILPFSLRHAIEVKQNIALGSLISSLIIGIALIIAATI